MCCTSRVVHGVGRDAAEVFIDVQLPANIRERALGALWPLAHPAAHANGCGNIRIAEIQPFCINQPMGMSDIATQRDSEIFAWLSEAAGLTAYGTRNPQVHASVGHACQLPENPPGAGKGFVDIP